MNTQYSTPEPADFQPPTVKFALTWRYYKSLHETTLAACFASSILDTNPHFIEIDRTEYEHLLKELDRV